jgi:hypothetical protein
VEYVRDLRIPLLAKYVLSLVMMSTWKVSKRTHVSPRTWVDRLA